MTATKRLPPPTTQTSRSHSSVRRVLVVLVAAAVGFLIGLYLLPGVVPALPSGLLGTRFGDKRIVVVGLLLMVAGGLIVGAGDNYGLVVVGRFISGIGAVLLNVLLTKMLIDWFADRELVLAMAILLNAWPISVAFALMTQGPLAEASSWTLVSYVTAAAACIGLLVVAPVFFFVGLLVLRTNRRNRLIPKAD